MIKFLSCLIKYPAFIGLTVLLVNVFCYQNFLSGSGWLNWTWFILCCLVSLLSGLFVSGAIFGDEDKTVFKLFNGLASFIVYGSIVLKIKLTGIADTNLIWWATTAFFLQNGIGQYSSLLASLISTIYIFTQYILLDNFYSIILFVVAILALVIAIISLWRTKIEDDDDYDITPIAALGLISVFVSFLIKSNFPEMTDNRLYLFGGFLIVSCYSFINNKALLYAILPIGIVAYVTYFVYTFNFLSIILISCLAIFSISSFGYVNNLKYIVNYLQSQVHYLEKENKSFANENQRLQNIVSELQRSQNNNSSNNNSSGSSKINPLTVINIGRALDWSLEKISELGTVLSS